MSLGFVGITGHLRGDDRAEVNLRGKEWHREDDLVGELDQAVVCCFLLTKR